MRSTLSDVTLMHQNTCCKIEQKQKELEGKVKEQESLGKNHSSEKRKYKTRSEDRSALKDFKRNEGKDTHMRGMCLLCAVHLHSVAKNTCYFVQSSYYSPAKMSSIVWRGD